MDVSAQLTCSISNLYQNRCSLTPSEAGVEDTVAVSRMIASSLSLLGSAAVILLVFAKRQLKNPKVHPIFALAVTDALLSILWILGGSAWLRQLENRVLCFVVSVPTVILECVTINLTLIYALHAYSGIKNRNPETLLLQRPDHDRPSKDWSAQATLAAYFIALALPVVVMAAIFTTIVICSNYKLLTEANDCACWCLPTLGNVLPLAISADGLTAKYVYYVYILETAYGAIVGTNYLLVFVLLVIVYSKSLIHIKKLRKQLENNENVSVAQVIEKGQTKAKRSVFAFLTVFLISGFCNFILAYTLIGLEMHLFVTYGFHRVTPSEYHRSRRSSKFGFLFFLLYMQSLTVPLQGFLNALVYAWTKEDFLKVMGILHVNDDIVEYYDNDDLSDEDLEQSVEECHTPRELEDSVTISIKSMPAMGSADHSSYQRRKESHVTRDYEHSSDHGGYNTY